MTPPERDYDDVLGRLLHSAMDPMEPAGDGLAKIQRRIAEPWLRRQMSLVRYEIGALGWLILVRCEPLINTVRPQAPASRRRRAREARSFGWLGPAMAWLRPALAVAGAVIIVVAGVFAMGQIQANLVGSGASATGGTGGRSITVGGGAGGSAAEGHNNSRGGRIDNPGVPGQSPRGGQAGASSGGLRNYSPSPSTDCGTPAPSPTPEPTTTPSPTPSPTPTATPTDSPTPTPTGSQGGGSPPPSGSPPPTSTPSTAALVKPIGYGSSVGYGNSMGGTGQIGSCGGGGLTPGLPSAPSFPGV